MARAWSFLCLCCGQAGAESLFDSHQVIDADLDGPLGRVIEDKEDRVEYPFTLLVDGTEHEILVRARGNSRLRVCRYPPLRLEFPARGASGALFESQDKLKLVTQCGDGAAHVANLLEEYLAYRIFNLVSDFSYRVRLLRIRYSDTAAESGDRLETRLGFVIESAEALAERTGASIAELPGVTRRSLDARQAARVFVFEYLLGNTDWSLVTAESDDACCHNIDLFERDGEYVTVPYDFDLSGLVNARYAKPDPALPIRSVTRRLYRGYCIPADNLVAALETFRGRQADLLALPAAIPQLPARDADAAVRYLASFFDRASDVNELATAFDHRCL